MACPTCAQHPSARLYASRFCPICARLRRILRLDALRSIWHRGGALWRWNEPTAHELDAHCACAAHCLLCADAVCSAPESAWACGAQCIWCAMRVCAGCAYAPKRLCPCAQLSQCAWGTALREARALHTAQHMAAALAPAPTTRVRLCIRKFQRMRTGMTQRTRIKRTDMAWRTHVRGVQRMCTCVDWRMRIGKVQRMRIRPIQRYKRGLRC